MLSRIASSSGVVAKSASVQQFKWCWNTVTLPVERASEYS
jgi:hypothetical protein